ncbi:hypothetical protein V8E53_010909 [Lactarius tabidus]
MSQRREWLFHHREHLFQDAMSLLECSKNVIFVVKIDDERKGGPATRVLPDSRCSEYAEKLQVETVGDMHKSVPVPYGLIADLKRAAYTDGAKYLEQDLVRNATSRFQAFVTAMLGIDVRSGAKAGDIVSLRGESGQLVV